MDQALLSLVTHLEDQVGVHLEDNCSVPKEGAVQNLHLEDSFRVDEGRFEGEDGLLRVDAAHGTDLIFY